MSKLNPRRATLLALGLTAGMIVAGCRQSQPPPPQTPIPTTGNPDALRPEPREKPLPGEYGDAHRPPVRHPIEDVPLYDTQSPEAPAYVEAYTSVGRPRIVVFVNRTLEGALIPVDQPTLVEGERRVREATGAVDTGTTVTESTGYYNTQRRIYEERFKTEGPARVEERAERYLPAGEYDEMLAKQIDYQTLENTLADHLAGDGSVTLVSPQLVRQRLPMEEVAALEAGRPATLDTLAERLGADVLVQIQARPTRQTENGLELRIIAEAINTAGGESIARAAVDFPPPMTADRLQLASRYLARMLMRDMTANWTSPSPVAPDMPTEPHRESTPTGVPGTQVFQPTTTAPAR